MNEADLTNIIRRAFAEDLPDITSEAIFAPSDRGSACFLVKADGVIAGLATIEGVFRTLDPSAEIAMKANDGDSVTAGDIVAEVKASVIALLSGRADGAQSDAAGLGDRHDDAALRRRGGGTRARRSTTRARRRPGCARSTSTRSTAGGGENHRIGLHDMFLVKNNHIDRAGSITAAVAAHPRAGRCRSRSWWRCATCASSTRRWRSGPDFILLDNMIVDELREAVRRTARPRSARSERRHHAGDGPRRRRDRSGPHLGRGADAFGDGAGYLDADSYGELAVGRMPPTVPERVLGVPSLLRSCLPQTPYCQWHAHCPTSPNGRLHDRHRR